jgi:hypothetical protein
MSDIAPDAKILEDGDDVLLKDTTEAGGENTEFADLAQLGKPAPGEVDVTAAAAKAPAKDAATAATPAEDDDLPAEFKGKSKKDILKMYQDAHKVIGRQGSELGELRAKADHAIKLSLEALRGRKPDAPAAAAKEEPLDESELFSKPTEFLNKALANSPVIKEIREALGQTAAAQATSRAAASTSRFNAAHPDAPEILRDPEFRQWVSASPVRSALLRRAHQMYDFDSGDEVFSTWKALKGVKQASNNTGEQPKVPAAPAAAGDPVSEAAKTLAAARKAKQDAAARAAGVPTSGAAGASAGKGGKPIFRRADVLRLMETDPERYEALSDEIRIAYEEGRVR